MRTPGRGEACAGCGSCGTAPGSGSRREFLRQGAAALALLAGARLPLAASVRPDIRFGAGSGPSGGVVTYALPTEDGATIDRGHQVILVRWEGAVYAFGLSCPHQRTVLRWDAGDGRFQCPKHHSRYAADGRYLEGRATRSMDRYGLRVEGAQVVVDTSRLFREDEDPAEWQAAVAVLGGDEPTGGESHGV